MKEGQNKRRGEMEKANSLSLSLFSSWFCSVHCVLSRVVFAAGRVWQSVQCTRCLCDFESANVYSLNVRPVDNDQVMKSVQRK